MCKSRNIKIDDLSRLDIDVNLTKNDFFHEVIYKKRITCNDSLLHGLQFDY
jgi:hypothetical protein